MISLLNQILTSQPLEKTYRRYIITKGDSRSALLIQELESNLQERCAGEAYAPWFDIVDVPRARRIYQSVWDAPRTCLICLISCISVLIRKPSEPKLLVERSRHVQDAKVEMEPDVQSIKLRHGKNSFKHAYPDIILTNGPATATIVLLAAALLRIIGRRGARDSMRGIYIESWARVKRLSLSAKVCLTLGLCERVVVQWEGLRGLEGWGARWIGWKGRQTEFRGWLVE